jgi:hypothetical protein
MRSLSFGKGSNEMEGRVVVFLYSFEKEDLKYRHPWRAINTPSPASFCPSYYELPPYSRSGHAVVRETYLAPVHKTSHASVP